MVTVRAYSFASGKCLYRINSKSENVQVMFTRDDFSGTGIKSTFFERLSTNVSLQILLYWPNSVLFNIAVSSS